jgi:hypothetical protein
VFACFPLLCSALSSVIGGTPARYASGSSVGTYGSTRSAPPPPEGSSLVSQASARPLAEPLRTDAAPTGATPRHILNDHRKWLPTPSRVSRQILQHVRNSCQARSGLSDLPFVRRGARQASMPVSPLGVHTIRNSPCVDHLPVGTSSAIGPRYSPSCAALPSPVRRGADMRP